MLMKHTFTNASWREVSAMRAFHDIKHEMRETCISLTRPDTGPVDTPMQKYKGLREQAKRPHAKASPFEPWMQAAFGEITRAAETGAPIALVSCIMNGKPAVVIGVAGQQGSKTHVLPLFLACQPWMNFSQDPDTAVVLGVGDFEEAGDEADGFGDV
jgi:hypothetical protein